MDDERTTCPACNGTKLIFTGNYGANDEAIMDECSLCDAGGMVSAKLFDDESDEHEQV